MIPPTALQIADQIKKLKPGGGSSLFDAIYMACTKHELVQGEPYEPRRVIIVVGDGNDNASKRSIDEVIEVIRASDEVDQARQRLMQVFDLTEIQAEYILELRLRRLTKFSQIELENEKAQLLSEIKDLKRILASKEALDDLVSNELAEVAQKYGDSRRTTLIADFEEVK